MTTTNRCWLIRNVICIFLFYINHLATAEEFKRVKRQQVGSDCTENIECLTSTGGSYCDSTKHCACLPTSVNIGGFCWPKINPGQNGCQYNEQCSGVWPGATCSSTSSCICPNNQPPSQTNDGTVCNNAGACPTNGFNSKLKISTTGADATCDTSVMSCSVLDYECFCSPPDPPNTGCVNSLAFCCPTRALACIMPKEEGTFSGAQRQNKWWYNSATDNCEQLSYNGLGGNANNFDSKAQCESYCKTACPRGRPAYGPLTSFTGMNIAPLVTCTSTSSTTTCGTNYYCNTATTSTGSYCCPLPAFVCGSTGGQVSKDGITPDVPDSGTGAPNLPTRTRYYYDSTTTTCMPFTYNGQGGNYNNFASQSECLSYCSRSVCTAGDPLRDINQTPLRCGTGGTSSCPSRYDCSSAGYCCPTKDFVCNQPVASGSCLNYVQRWYYDRNSGACSQFTYNGCQGNFNNFNTYSACITFCTDVSSGARCPQGTAQRDSGGAYVVCSGGTSNGVCSAGYYCYYDGRVYGCCPTISQTCQFETSDAGTACVTPVTRWYLNSQTGQCATFTYNGCDGNSNNFATQIDCQDYCGVGGCPEGGMPYRETTNGQYRTCTLAGNECQSGYACARVTLTTSSTNNYCCPTRDTICRMSQDPGTFCGTSTLTRYFFNQNTRTCESFTYRGCGGNRNNFGTLNTCLSYCNSAACPSGQIAFQDLANRQLTSCTVGGTNCPSSYTCTQSTLLNQGICCGSNAPPGTCISGQTAYMDSLTNGPLQCQQNVDGQCQSPYICQYSATQANSFCCGVAVARCPNGGNVALTTAGQAQQCTPNVVNNCASGFTCQPTTVLVGNVQSATGYCCGTPSNRCIDPCGTGFTTLFTNNQATTCIVGATPSSCTSPYACQATTSGQAYCCTAQTTTVAVCAVGKSPLMILNVPTICTSSGSTSTGCPSGYTCDLYAASNSFYCCTSSTATTQRCPAGFSVLQPEQTCGTSPDSCPTSQGAFCNFDSTTRRFICCTGGTVVPTSTVCPGGQPLAGTACTTSGQCSGGYTCKPSTGNGVCCPSAVSVCSLPQNVGTTCSTSTSSQRYYYNTATRSCSPFTFQGCNGNNNNFATLQSCEDFCMMGLCSRGKAQGISGQAVQTCTTNVNCQSGYDCTVPAYGGGSNVCCPSRTTNCNMPQDIGRICATQVTTPLNFWYYNSNSRTCQTFSYNGCGGNGNNFETIADCQSNCASSPAGNPCPSPATAQINPSTNQPQVCNFGSSTGTGCGAQYNCRYSNTANNYYCCSRVGVNGCATGTAYLYPNTQSPLACTQGGPPCPAGYSCVQSSAYAGFQCCSTTAAAALPGNLSRVQTSISCTSDTYCVSKFGAGAQCNMSAFKCLQPSG